MSANMKRDSLTDPLSVLGGVSAREDLTEEEYDEVAHELDQSVSTEFHPGRLGNNDEDSSNSSDLNHRQDRILFYSRYLLFFLLVALTTACATVTYALFSRNDKLEFEQQFAAFAAEVIDVSAVTADNIYAAMTQVQLTIETYAQDNNATFPFITVPHFESKAQQMFRLSGATSLGFSVIVLEEEKLEWQNYSVANQGWIQDGLDTQGEGTVAVDIFPYINRKDTYIVPDEGPADPYYAVTWQLAPTPAVPTNVNFNEMTGRMPLLVLEMDETHQPALSKVLDASDNLQQATESFERLGSPQAVIVQPLIAAQEFVGYLTTILPWNTYFENILPEGTKPLHMVLRNTCGQAITFEIHGAEVKRSADEDIHENEFTSLGRHALFNFSIDQTVDSILEVDVDLEYWTDVSTSSTETDDDILEACQYQFSIYPTLEFRESFDSSQTIVSTVGVVIIFLLTSAVFVLYDFMVNLRHRRIKTTAAKSGAIVSNLFPKQIRDQLLEQQEEMMQLDTQVPRTKGLSRVDHMAEYMLNTKPIAELFPSATVLFADISNFTAWASTREATQVFLLLEQVYSSFDRAAERRRIFKVETIGDCYVAASGLPEARPDHAVAMARFANECLSRFHVVVVGLEKKLGPDTGDLGIRMGMHSGPVTAGVLRGSKSRFQLFGDTVNKASRLESTGKRNQIHLSSTTAELLIQAGKESWLQKCGDAVNAKGIGFIECYWLTLSPLSGSLHTTRRLSGESTKSINSRSSFEEGLQILTTGLSRGHDASHTRLIAWNTDVLVGLLKQILATRPSKLANHLQGSANWTLNGEGMVLDEVVEVIVLPQKEVQFVRDPSMVEIDPVVESQIREYVSRIAGCYRDNPFHNFEHASHVMQSVVKLMSRIVTLEDIDYNNMQYKKKGTLTELHEYTYGITSDPLTQFACAFSALIHDVDHVGIPNTALVEENTELAKRYEGKSVAEQNSVNLAWSLFMSDDFSTLRSCIFESQNEFDRFRQLVVNSVMATDIADKELGLLRKERWAKAFFPQRRRLTHVTMGTTLEDIEQDQQSSSEHMTHSSTKGSCTEDTNRKATIVIEHLIQASDVSHTMQHWRVYLKWNERLFRELYNAYIEGRVAADPSISWYKGEIGFFDFYVIPLAKKLQECGVFGVSGHEYLHNAEANRNEWSQKGESIVDGYLKEIHKTPLGT
eukprot:Nitzschia sp. Nitz4//scaffold45_size130396//87784//91702//NITZ4_003463-RA/size130396-processed-gene-0.197-mRNA-1//1//CDS//3329552440//7107//frame0